jgi:hypothetical protein
VGQGKVLVVTTAQDGKEGYTVLAKVAHVRRDDAGNWALCCQFISELSDEELQRLLPANMNETLPIGGDSHELPPATQAAPASNGTPKERQRIPSVQLNLEIASRTTIDCMISDFAAGNCQWPFAAGTIGSMCQCCSCVLGIDQRRCQCEKDQRNIFPSLLKVRIDKTR